MKPSSLSPRLRSRSLLLMDSIPVLGFACGLAAYSCVVSVGRPCMVPGPRRFKRCSGKSELEATLAGGFCQGLDAAVVAVARAVERDLLDAGSNGALGDQLADAGGRFDVLVAL